MTGSPATQPYDQTIEYAATLAGEQVRIVTKPGFAAWDRVTQAQISLATTFSSPPDAQVLLIGGGPGGLAATLARAVPDGRVVVSDASYLALTMTEQTLAANQIENVQICLEPVGLPDSLASYDAVVIEAPPDRKLARRWLAVARAALRSGGRLTVAGANDHGIRSVVADMEALFGNAVVLDVRRRTRTAAATKAESTPPPEWLQEPGIAPGSWHEFGLTARGHDFRLRSLPGVFAYDRLDEGTELLLAHLDVPVGGRVLDVGCGYGIIGLVAARLGAAKVDMGDTSLPAIAATEQNIAMNDIRGARALPSDLLDAVEGMTYDLIVTNPPFHAGKETDLSIAHALIEQAAGALAPGGRLVLVANAFLRYDQQLRQVFSSVQRLAETRRYHVYQALVPPAS